MKVALNSKIEYEIAKALEDYSKATGRSKASIIEAALSEYFNKQARP
jgi:predicted DNA-binding protein